MNLLANRQRQVFEGLFGSNHRFSLIFGFGIFESVETCRTFASASSFTRFN